jgi:hypothetical protein
MGVPNFYLVGRNNGFMTRQISWVSKQVTGGQDPRQDRDQPPEPASGGPARRDRDQPPEPRAAARQAGRGLAKIVRVFDTEAMMSSTNGHRDDQNEDDQAVDRRRGRPPRPERPS